MKYDILRAGISLFAPNCCPFCGGLLTEFEYWHEECCLNLPLYNGKKDIPDGLDDYYTVCCYQRAARKAIIELKKGMKYAADAMALLMTEAIGGREFVKGAVLVPVPSSFKSLLFRGYQPAESIARYMSMCCRIPVIAALKSTDEKLSQKSLNAQQRKYNAQSAFIPCRKIKRIKGKRVILVDDICTTGSTLSACANILRQAGAEEIIGITFAKTVRTRGKERKKQMPVKVLDNELYS